MGRRPSTEPRGTHAGQFVPARREGELHKSFSEGGGEGRREGRRKGKEGRGDTIGNILGERGEGVRYRM